MGRMKLNIIAFASCILLLNLISLNFSAQKYGFERVDSVTVTVGGAAVGLSMGRRN